MRDVYYVDEGGILNYPDGRAMSPVDAASKINSILADNVRYKERIAAFQAQAIDHQADIVAFRHDLEVAEHERDEARKELAEWRRTHSQPICNPPEATREYVDVMAPRCAAKQSKGAFNKKRSK